ncbi:MAG: glycerol-3-phosphate dehydrogenase [Gammaproteobacteria bacterium]
MSESYDVLIIGGGINGTAIAAHLAQVGIKVILCEKNDIASATSSASSKLIHGGLRYLKYYQVNFVRQALQEQQELMRSLPHLVKPIEFVLPHSKAQMPYWKLRLGLWLYDHLTKRNLPYSHAINLTTHAYGSALKAGFNSGFVYYDCWTNDARLCILNAQQARDFGANINNYTEVVRCYRLSQHWDVTLEDIFTQSKRLIQAKCIINATGPWVEQIAENLLSSPLTYPIELVQGSHIIVPKLCHGEQAYILPQHDERIIFVIPYLNKYHLIGTTEVILNDMPSIISAREDEINYLCECVNRYFIPQITPQQIIKSYSGIRTLLKRKTKNISSISRESTLELNEQINYAPCLHIIGGKLTSHRHLAHQVYSIIKKYFKHINSENNLYINDTPNKKFYSAEQLKQNYPWLTDTLQTRYYNYYGKNCTIFLEGKNSIKDLGYNFGAGLTSTEIDYLIAYEWAKAIDDIIWRRTELGFELTDVQRLLIADYIDININI